MRMMEATLWSVVLLLTVIHQGVSQLNNDQKQLLLDLHNWARGNVTQPRAADMERMQWNNELAGVAQTYSARCVFEHNPNRASQAPSFRNVGENLAISSGRGDAYEFLFTLWHDERQHYTYSTRSCDANQVCGHYTQVVWATSNQLGCGATMCATVEGFRGTNALNLVCNYGPAGNFRGQFPYISGASCSSCPTNQRLCSSNLCSNSTGSSSIPGGSGAAADNRPTLLMVTTLVMVIFSLLY
ncbi:peptidase inhibitor 16-like [Dysidea avara]|uniref:peptidase inhibitor 16-like n=1 Tax=Dysidea avara TaxID=196820 RepID=UPI0033259454